MTGTPRVSFRLPLGEARVVEGAAGEVSVVLDGRESAVGRFIVEMRGDELVIEPDRTSAIRWSSVDLTIRLGEPGDIRARLTSADLKATIDLRSVHVESASGDIVIAYGKEQARELKGPAKGQAAPKGAPSAKAELAASWRLTPDDHIGSLMYIEWIRSGGDLDRDKLEEIRREVSRLRSGLDGFFSL